MKGIYVGIVFNIFDWNDECEYNLFEGLKILGFVEIYCLFGYFVLELIFFFIIYK